MPKLLQQCIDDAFEIEKGLSKFSFHQESDLFGAFFHQEKRNQADISVLNTERLKELLTDYLKNGFQAELASISDLQQLSAFEKNLVEYAQKEAKFDISSQLKLINKKKQAFPGATAIEDTVNLSATVEPRPVSAERDNVKLHKAATAQLQSQLSISSRPVYLLRDKYVKTCPELTNLLENTLPQCKLIEVSYDPDADPIDIITGLDFTCPPVLIFGPMSYKRRLDELKLRREFGLIAFNVAYLSFELLDDVEITRVKQFNQQSNIQPLLLDKDKPHFYEEQIKLLQSLLTTKRPKFTQQAPVSLDDALALLKIFKKRLENKATLNDRMAKLIANMINEIESLKEQNISTDRVMAIYNLIEQIARPHKTKEDIKKADQAIHAFAKHVAYSPASTVARSLGVIALTALGILAAVTAVVGIGMAVGLWLGPMAATTGFVALFSGSFTNISIGLAMTFGVAATGLTSALLSKTCLFNNPQQNIAKNAHEIWKLENPTFIR